MSSVSLSSIALAHWYIALAAANGLVAVGLGAFGAHGLRARLSEPMLNAWQTAVQYHFYHVFALLVVALLLQQWGKSTCLSASGGAFLLGLLLFCGSLYGLALGGPRWLGPITPLGGVCFMVGWLLLFCAVFVHKN